jgi:predicted Zn-dependent protease
MDVLLMPDQMMLQIHESIGHPLELDRILGDERNFAGTSFVTLDMFGHYQYGSELLNVTFDPTRPEQLASYAFDDDGDAGGRDMLIENGILKRPLGGAVSQARAGLAGVANAAPSSWNRAPIDRMANLNVEPGTATLASTWSRVERGVLMAPTSRGRSTTRATSSSSAASTARDDPPTASSPNSVRNPNYRGISATFWRSLAMVGDAHRRR